MFYEYLQLMHNDIFIYIETLEQSLWKKDWKGSVVFLQWDLCLVVWLGNDTEGRAWREHGWYHVGPMGRWHVRMSVSAVHVMPRDSNRTAFALLLVWSGPIWLVKWVPPEFEKSWIRTNTFEFILPTFFHSLFLRTFLFN